jgi:hypothetical protein
LKAIREYAAAHDIKVVNVHRAEGVSGTKESPDRPAWSEQMTGFTRTACAGSQEVQMLLARFGTLPDPVCPGPNNGTGLNKGFPL